ncbi:hypothetical protein FACS1894206_09960 [Deltaproteobacteria bacterium]|nr:hypothetical protein FACS1894206_09960 [Deltaproteobacteria bacterium]
MLAVLGLCAAVMPVTGFWVAKNDMQRGIVAIRMPLNAASGPASRPVSRQATRPDGRAAALTPAVPLAVDGARYRATLRDVPKPTAKDAAPTLAEKNGNPRSVISLFNNQVVLALADETYLPLRRISGFNPSQTYQMETERFAFLPADGHHRNADISNTHWLTNSAWKAEKECEAITQSSLLADMGQLLTRLRTSFTFKPHPKSVQYMELIDSSAKRFGLSPQLVYGIMRTESAFNPFAVSNAGALGLMQVVPESAGNEVHLFLTGKPAKPSSSFLFDPKSNVEYGCAYLHLLSTRYFASVKNRSSRVLCMIAGYNAGPNAVLKLFGTNPEAAVSAINEISSEELYKKLSRSMPAEETRLYIGRVLSNINIFPG